MWWYDYLPARIPQSELGPAQDAMPAGLEDELALPQPYSPARQARERDRGDGDRAQPARPAGTGQAPDFIRQIGNVVGEVINRLVRGTAATASGPAAPVVAGYIPNLFRPTPRPQPAAPAPASTPDRELGISQPDFTGGGGRFDVTDGTARGEVTTARGVQTVEVALPFPEAGFRTREERDGGAGFDTDGVSSGPEPEAPSGAGDFDGEPIDLGGGRYAL